MNHTFLDISFTNNKVVLSMNSHLEECIASFGEIFNGGATTPANSALFEVAKDSEILEMRTSKRGSTTLSQNYCSAQSTLGRTLIW